MSYTKRVKIVGPDGQEGYANESAVPTWEAHGWHAAEQEPAAAPAPAPAPASPPRDDSAETLQAEGQTA